MLAAVSGIPSWTGVPRMTGISLPPRLPEQVKESFSQNCRYGDLQHGTVTVMMDKEGFEVTTYRVDGEYR